MEGTGLYAYGFRYYDPVIGRFTGVDPIADQFAFVSGFNYAENRPVRGIDLHGLQYVEFNEGLTVGQAPASGETGFKASQPSWLRTQINSAISWGSNALSSIDRTIRQGLSNAVNATVPRSTGQADYLADGVNVNGLDESTAYQGMSAQAQGAYNGAVDALPDALMNVSALAGASSARRGRASSSSSSASASTNSRYISVYHKGALENGKVGTHRTFSTGYDFESVSALDRRGGVHEFRVPENQFYDWMDSGVIQELRDLDSETGVYNLEVRFHPVAAEKLNTYKVNGGQ